MGNAATHKENLVWTAMRLFRRQGYASTGLQQIPAESGAPKGPLYHYFETAPESPAITAAGQPALDAWIDVVAGVLAKGGTERREARSRAQLIVAAMEGALILSRIRQSSRPILDIAKLAELASPGST